MKHKILSYKLKLKLDFILKVQISGRENFRTLTKPQALNRRVHNSYLLPKPRVSILYYFPREMKRRFEFH